MPDSMIEISDLKNQICNNCQKHPSSVYNIYLMTNEPIKTMHVFFDKQEKIPYEMVLIKKCHPVNSEVKLKTNKMKHLSFFPILLIFAFITSCSDEETISGSGNLFTESRDVDFFEKVRSEGVFDVSITQGNSKSVEITADDNIINQVRTRVINNELQLYLDDNFNYNGITVKANITTTSLNALINSGVGNMFVYDVDQSGAFSIYNSGTGDISIGGSAANLSITDEGSGDIMAFDFYVENCSIDIEGSGSVYIHCSDNLDVNIEGSGHVHYKGSPAVNTSITGSGSVIDAN